MSTPTKLISYEDSLTMPENRFEEIVHGESRIMPPPTKNHALLLETLAKLLWRQLDEGEYSVISTGAGLGIQRVPLTYRIPDLMVFRAGALDQDALMTAENDLYMWTVPDLIVECLSPANRKGSIRELLSDYAQIAAPELWLLDPEVPRWTSYYYGSGAMCEGQTAAAGIVQPLCFPNVNVDLAVLWAAFNRKRP